MTVSFRELLSVSDDLIKVVDTVNVTSFLPRCLPDLHRYGGGQRNLLRGSFVNFHGDLPPRIRIVEMFQDVTLRSLRRYPYSEDEEDEDENSRPQVGLVPVCQVTSEPQNRHRSQKWSDRHFLYQRE